MKGSWLALVLVVCVVGWARSSENLLSNPSLEEGEPAPAHWSTLNLWGTKAGFGVEMACAHGGARAFRISCGESTQAFLFSEPVPVAAGETLDASAWVKVSNAVGEETDEGSGDVALVANFFEGDGRTEEFRDIATTRSSAGGEWQQLSGKVKVPAQAATLRLRVGLRDMSGVCLVDDVSLTAREQVVARADLADERVTPELRGIPVTIINRGSEEVEASVRVSLGDVKATAQVDVAGRSARATTVPVEIPERKQLPLEVALLEQPAQRVLFAEQRKVTAPPEMVLSPPIPTHWAVEDGPPKVEGDVDLAVTPQRREASVLEVSLTSRTGAVLAKWFSETIKDGFNHFELKCDNPSSVGEYRLIAQLRPKKGTEKPLRGEGTFTVIPREQARAVLNKDGFLEYRGKAIFPLGIFNGPAKVVEMGKAGFTINHAYNAANAEVGKRPNDSGLLRFLDDTQKNGMMAVLLIPRGLAFGGDWENFRRRIRMFKNHPALLAWDEEEGLARGDMEMAGLVKMRQIIREEDPHHPFMVGDSRDVIGKVKDRSNFFPLAHMDLGMWWWYPIPPGGAQADALQGEELTKVTQLDPPSFLTLAKTDKPIWVGVQAYKKPKNFGRYSTPTEYRAQAYIAVIHGAKGLMWYGGSVPGGIYQDPKSGNWDYLKSLARELREMSPVFMSQTLETPKLTPADAPVSAMIKKAGERVVLMAVNRGSKEVNVTFNSTHLKGKVAKVLYEGRSAEVSGGSLKDSFKPYQTHVYEWALSP